MKWTLEILNLSGRSLSDFHDFHTVLMGNAYVPRCCHNAKIHSSFCVRGCATRSTNIRWISSARNEEKKAFCVLDRDKSALVWISCSYIDYTTFLRNLNEHGLNQCQVKFTSDIYTWDGEGTVGNMKVMPNGTDVKVSEAKVRYIRNYN